MCCPTSSQSRVTLRRSIAVDFLSYRSVSCSCSQQRWPGSLMTRSLARLVAETHHLLPLSCQLSQHCSRPWEIRQLTVEDVIRRRVCQHRHGFSYARSATMMDDTLTIVSLEPVKMVTTQSQITESTKKVWTPQCPSMCHVSKLSLGHLSDDRSNISALSSPEDHAIALARQ